MAEIASINVLFYIDGVAVANSTSNTLSVNQAEIDITSKDSSRWKNILSGTKDWSIDVEAFVDFSDSKTADDFFALLDGSDGVAKFSNEVSGEKYWGGNCKVTSLTLNGGGVDDAYSFSCTLVGNGALDEYTKT